MVEAVRAGTIFANGKHGQRAYDRWIGRRKRAKGQQTGLTGAALERAITGLAYQHPEYVVFGGA